LIAVPTGTTPGGTGWTYYPTTATVGYGGSGSSRAVYQSVPRNFSNWWYSGNWGWGWGYDQVLVAAAVPSTPGGPGYVVLEFTPQSLWCKDLGDWKPVQTLYVKDNNVWQPVKALYVKQNNVWTVVVADNGSAPNPVSQVGVNWGRSPRAYS
jgi:hypothetical protein